jgi:predicted Zn-dependent protease
MGQGLRNREQHLAAINGMVFDDDPRQGIIEGRDFLHPDLRVAFTAPQGFALQNGVRGVSVVGQSGQAEFSMAPASGNLETYIGQVYRTIGGNQAQIQYSRPEPTTINGIPAAYSIGRAQTQQGVVDVSVVAYQFAPDRIYHITTITQGGSGPGPFTPMIQSVRRLTSQQAAAIRPRIIQVVTVGAGDTVQTLAGRMAYSTYQLERFRALNGLGLNGSVQPGQRVKLVVYGNRS